MNAVVDPVLVRGIERIIIALSASLFCFLGYKLFRHGVTKGYGSLSFQSKLLKIVFSGTGPGLFFMAFGALVLIVAVRSPLRYEWEDGDGPHRLVMYLSKADPRAVEALVDEGLLEIRFDRELIMQPHAWPDSIRGEIEELRTIVRGTDDSPGTVMEDRAPERTRLPTVLPGGGVP